MDFIRTAMTALFFTIYTSVTAQSASAGTAKDIFQTCVNVGIPAMVRGVNFQRYISLDSFSFNVVGRGNWRSLDTSGKTALNELVLATLKQKATTAISEQAAKGIDLTQTRASISTATQQKNGLYEVTGTITTPTGNQYDFNSTASTDGSNCQLHTLWIQGLFSIAQDLQLDSNIQTFMTKHRLKR